MASNAAPNTTGAAISPQRDLLEPRQLQPQHVLSVADIASMHKQFVDRAQDYYATPEYKGAVGPVGSYHPRAHDAPRFFAMLDLRIWLSRHSIQPTKVLSFDKKDPELSLLPASAHVFEANYGANPVLYDLHVLALPDTDFDFVVFGQTLEHLHNPWLAMRRVHAHMRKGAYLFTSVPFVNIQHMTPHHFYHFSPTGLLALFHYADFATVELGCWGNLDYITKVFSNYTWPNVYQLATIENDPRYTAQCWILVQK
jgi:SAM-dependent methyltransferase